MIRFLLLFCIIVLGYVPTAKAKNITLGDWKSLPILYEGRVEPLDSFARVHLKKFSGQYFLDQFSASEWLALNLFDPALAVEIPVFKIRDASKYGLSENRSRLYSYSELVQLVQSQQVTIDQLLKISSEEWTPQQQELIELYEHYILNTQILRSLTLILPLGISDDAESFLDFRKTQSDLKNKVQNIVKKKGTDLENYNEEEKEISFLSYQLGLLENSASNNVLFRIIPDQWGENATNWFAPWGVIRDGIGGPKTSEYLSLWHDMAIAYRTQNQDMWKKSVDKARIHFNNSKLKLETFYNTVNLKTLSLFLFSSALLMLVISHFTKSSRVHKILNSGAVINFGVGAFSLLILISMRVYLLDRPPVGTLYESILFVALICALGFLIMFWRSKNITTILLGSIAGVTLMTTALGFVGDDTMGTLVAVLNTNFWLGTHVLCITMGYGTCLIASLMAHRDLWMRMCKPQNLEFQKQSLNHLNTIVIISLLLTTIGTILGGIWADQSWGRFWGWDPKENGALLIVLWLAWIIHSKISNHMSDLGYVIGTAYLSVIIVLAWFGVNLLNVGLHSYGFISGVATGIIVFCATQTLLLVAVWWKIAKRCKA